MGRFIMPTASRGGIPASSAIRLMASSFFYHRCRLIRLGIAFQASPLFSATRQPLFDPRLQILHNWNYKFPFRLSFP